MPASFVDDKSKYSVSRLSAWDRRHPAGILTDSDFPVPPGRRRFQARKLQISLSCGGAIRTLTLVLFISFAFATNLQMSAKAETTSNVHAKASVQKSSSRNFDESTASAMFPKTLEGPYLRPQIIAGPFDIHRRYRSMEGPWVMYKFQIGELASSKEVVLPESDVQYVEGNPQGGAGKAISMGGVIKQESAEGLVSALPSTTQGKKRELYWFKGLKLDVIDENGKVMPTAEFICHLNMDVDKDFRNKLFFEGESCKNSRIFTATQGETDMCFPEGFAVPVASDEQWTVYFQAANRSTDAHRKLKHRCTMYFIKDSDLIYPVKALSWFTPFATVVVDKDTKEASESEHGLFPHCLGSSSGVTAPNSAPLTVFTDGFGRRVSGHWVVPPGKFVYHGPITQEREADFSTSDRKVHFVWTHVHPCCTTVSLVQCAAASRKPLFTANINTRTQGGLELMHIDTISSKEGITVPANQAYEIEASYDNSTEQPLDSMVSLGIFFEDNRFARPMWALAHNPENVFCGVGSDACKVPLDAFSKSKPPEAKDLPPFETKIDGPLLTEAKTVDLETSAGHIHLRLDPKDAPVNATQMYKLLTKGCFNETPFVRYEKNFVLQLAFADTKTAGATAMSSESKQLLRRLPLEVTSQEKGSLNHKKFVLSMARETDVPDSASSSFSILLGEAPHLDHLYTIFGQVIPDEESLATLERITRDWALSHPYIISAKDVDVHASSVKPDANLTLSK